MTTERSFPAPPPLAKTLDRWDADGRPAGVEPKLAATVLLVRPDGSEVFMIRRVPTMEFAPSMWVFPGGGVDPRDAEVSVDWVGPDATQWARLLGVSAEVAVTLVMAALRELFEECGVLLVGTADAVLTEIDDSWMVDRAALIAHEKSFAEVLHERGLAVRSDLLFVQDHWVTPGFEKRRYDTFFFTAVLPEGQEPDDATSESAVSQWVQPTALLAEHQAGSALMLPPTVLQLELLRDEPHAPGHHEIPIAVEPTPQLGPDGWLLVTQLNPR
ncbi:NUDIX domain-containing protein [Branchiibius hedensis]|uniref:NUDIX domain-containing protein n=1 Tax=Branchiibius hedensis TaxID=672460 RepID=A0A2Y9A1B0_9MICO|nr:NUDIX hydrolase [Branchiibius hedensis]PWJ27469.1 NUDIX domain-containing protein [Branchiibius hedensis]SSA36279.1 NUDIX domain-containing protein [Branchiibius hedensis]